jgi:VanZ family protein
MIFANSLPLHRALAIGVFFVALLIVAVLLLMPAAMLVETDVWDKLEHAGAFAGLTLLGCLAFPERSNAARLAVGLVAFGSVCETLQMFVPGRSASVEDAIANTIGVLIVSGLWRLGHYAITWRCSGKQVSAKN